MEDWFEIPQGRRAPRPVRLCLMLGLTALLLMAQAGGTLGF
ncbi:MAG: hypothetical protein Q8Q26_08095 [Pseudorhodobacter sp.]|nr:hypothetical protein [Pseudorhodobacter sp.]